MLVLGTASFVILVFLAVRAGNLSPRSGGPLLTAGELYDSDAVETFFGELAQREAQTRRALLPSDPCWQPESAKTRLPPASGTMGGPGRDD